MLTIDEIKNISFRKANRGGGYHPDDVDSFIDDVVATFEQMKREKSDLIRKMDILANRIEKYRADEEIVRNALISSQRISDETIKDANEKAEGIIKDAEARAQLMVMDANKAVLAKKDEMLKLEKDAADMRETILSMYKKHIEVISQLPTQQDVETLKEKLDVDSKDEVTAPVTYEPEAASEELLTDVQPAEADFDGGIPAETADDLSENFNGGSTEE